MHLSCWQGRYPPCFTRAFWDALRGDPNLSWAAARRHAASLRDQGPMGLWPWLLVITGYFYGIIHSINGFLLVLIIGISGHNCMGLSNQEEDPTL